MQATKIVRFNKYLQHELQFDIANQTILTLHLSGFLAGHLMTAHENSTLAVRDIYPSVPHVKRLTLNTDQTYRRIQDGDSHLAKMALPYLLLLYQEAMDSIYFYTTQKNRPSYGANFSTILSKFETLSEVQFSNHLKLNIQILASMRNSLVHTGGLVNKNLVNEIASSSDEFVEYWQRRTGFNISELREGMEIPFTLHVIILAFEICKESLREANGMLVRGIERSRWVDIFTEDLFIEHPKIIKNSRGIGQARGFARENFDLIKITDEECLQVLDFKSK